MNPSRKDYIWELNLVNHMVHSVIIRWDYKSDGDSIAEQIQEGLTKLGFVVKVEGADKDDNFGVRIAKVE